jgi:hypothetical protein
MPKYEVVIEEKLWHSLVVEAEDEEKALIAGVELLSNQHPEYLEQKHEYFVDGEFTSHDRVYEVMEVKNG